jgi:hypothetical protein
MPRITSKQAVDSARIKDCLHCGASFVPPDHNKGAVKCASCRRKTAPNRSNQFIKDPTLSAPVVASQPTTTPRSIPDARLDVILEVHRYILAGNLLGAEQLVKWAFEAFLISHEERRAFWAYIDERDCK